MWHMIKQIMCSINSVSHIYLSYIYKMIYLTLLTFCYIWAGIRRIYFNESNDGTCCNEWISYHFNHDRDFCNVKKNC